MATTFIEVVNELLDWANRPQSDTAALARAKACINDAILWANRSHRFKMADRMSTIVYPANAAFVNLGVVCDGGTVGSLSTIQMVADAAGTSGRAIPLTSYGELQNRRFNSDSMDGVSPMYVTRPLTDSALNFDRMVQSNWTYIAFLMGDKFGLYPKPTVNVNLAITYNLIFPKLVADSDTNFFLDYCKDFIISKALQRFNIFLKDDARIVISESQIESDWKSLIRWDDEVLTNSEIRF